MSMGLTQACFDPRRILVIVRTVRFVFCNLFTGFLDVCSSAALPGDFEAHDCPAALVKAASTTWYVDKASLADFTPK